MKTRVQALEEMKALLEDDLVRQNIIAEYKKYQFENDEKLKGNAEADKELKAAIFGVYKTEAMLKWIANELK